ncbi:hypothetical protein NM208_g7497 [Fusarium decemcellulare]|uniref:Uncharacterized protein n=1 Tax=Fusarium decemcellulare TaxID=57161 RepID=A0ACC1S936_9HYPO|nr:hypothetical protein NM208_g7497 [Fusarium decemcellulare]
MPTRRKPGPTWGLLLPGSILDGKEAPLLLGRIVANVDDLLQDFVPDNPQLVINSIPGLEAMKVVDNDVETFIATTDSKDAKLRLTQIFGMSGENTQQSSGHVKARTVITRLLRQHDKVFTALMKAHKDEIVQLLRKQPTQRGYMIVGVKTCINAQMSSSDQSSSDAGITFELPLQEAAMAFGVPPLPLNLANPSIQVTRDNSRELLSRFMAVGERVFSVRVREIKFHGLINKQPGIGEALQFPPQQGTYGGRKEECSAKSQDVDDEMSEVTLEKIDVDDDAEDVLFASFSDPVENSTN